MNRKNNENEKDALKDEQASGTSSRLEIIMGSRKRSRIRRIVTLSVIVLIVMALIIINALTPTGLIESIQNEYATFGSGTFPVDIYAQNCTDFSRFGKAVTTLNGSYFEVYNTEGKLIQAQSHGMSQPSLRTSASRFLLFDRDRYTAKVYNYSDELYSMNFDKVIYSADIGRDGTVAVATGSDSYMGTVYVYNSDNKLVYTWNSAGAYILDVAVSSDGKKIAVCLGRAENGAYKSYVNILGFGSAEPVYRYEYNLLMSSVTSVSDEYMIVNGVDGAAAVKWDSSYSENIMDGGVVRSVAVCKEGISAVCYGMENNLKVNSIAVFGKDGVKISQFSFSSRVDGISVSENCVCVLSQNDIYVFGHDGVQLGKAVSDTKPLYVALCVDGSVLAVNSSKIQKLITE